MKYMEFPGLMGLIFTGKTETAPYEFRFGMMEHHKQKKVTYMKFVLEIYEICIVHGQMGHFTLLSGPKQPNKISRSKWNFQKIIFQGKWVIFTRQNRRWSTISRRM